MTDEFQKKIRQNITDDLLEYERLTAIIGARFVLLFRIKGNLKQEENA